MAKRKTRRERRTFTDEYKQHVLELVRAGDKSISQICRELDLTQSSVHNSESDQEELQRLRAENKQLKTERDILKKATAFFAKNSQ